MWDYEEYYQEPSVTDIIIEEAKQKLEECIKDSVKKDIEYIKSENTRLKEENQEYRDKEYSLRSRELVIKQKEQSLERDFLKNKFTKLLEPFIENKDIYVIEKISKLIPKCDKCDNDRKKKYTSEQGEDIYADCTCNKRKTYYQPIMKSVKTVNFYKDNKGIRLTPKFEGDSYDYTYFKIDFESDPISEFNEDIANDFIAYKDYFIDEAICEKYCDYFNKKNGVWN